jgi:hypothetical protein
MTPFGPFYPIALQSAVNHAERFIELLEGYELEPPSDAEGFVAWLTGRGDEVLRFVESTVADWKKSVSTADEAGMRIELYLRQLHESLVHQGVVTDATGLPSCCIGVVNTTAAATLPEARTTVREVVRSEPVRPAHSGTVIAPIESVLVDLALEPTPKSGRG